MITFYIIDVENVGFVANPILKAEGWDWTGHKVNAYIFNTTEKAHAYAQSIGLQTYELKEF